MIQILIPGTRYSENKKSFTKLREKHGVKNWNGSGWSSDRVTLSANFQKAALKTGKPHDYDGDIFTLSGSDTEFIDEFVKLSKNLGALIEKSSTPIIIQSFLPTKEDIIKAEIRTEKHRLQSSNMTPEMQKNWLKLHEVQLRKRY